MSFGRVVRTITLAFNPSDVEFNLVTETEGCQLTYLYQQFEIPSASAFKGKGTRHAVGETKNSCISNMFRTHHHLQTTKKSACLAQQDVVSEFPCFWTELTTRHHTEFTTGWSASTRGCHKPSAPFTKSLAWKKESRADDPGFRLKRLRSRTRPCCATFWLRPLPNTQSVSRGPGIGGSNNWTPRESPRALQEVHQTQETHQLSTCTVLQRLTGIVGFTDERVNGEECAQTTALLDDQERCSVRELPPRCVPASASHSKRTQEPS